MTQLITGKEVKLFQKLVSLVEGISALLVTGKVQDVTSRHLVQISGVEKYFNTRVTHFNVLFVNLWSKIRRFCSCSHVRVPHLVKKVLLTVARLTLVRLTIVLSPRSTACDPA